MQDRSPLKFDGRWLWYNRDHELADSGNHADHLPAEVFGLLSGFLPRENQKVTELVKSYPTREAAMSAYREASEAAATPTEADIQAALDFGRTADQHLRAARELGQAIPELRQVRVSGSFSTNRGAVTELVTELVSGMLSKSKVGRISGISDSS